MTIKILSVIIAWSFFLPTLTWAVPPLPDDALELMEMEFIKIGVDNGNKMKIPANWWYQMPLFYETEDIIHGQVSMPRDVIYLKNTQGQIVASIMNGLDVWDKWGEDVNWRDPEILMTQARVRKANMSWLRFALVGERPGEYERPETIVSKQIINDQWVILMKYKDNYQSSESWPRLAGEWDVIQVCIYNSILSEHLYLSYHSAYAEKLGPLMETIINSITPQDNKPNEIDGSLSQGGQVATLNLPETRLSLSVPATWAIAEANPTALPYDEKGEVTGRSPDILKPTAESQTVSLAKLLPTGQGKIEMNKADHNLYLQKLSPEGKILSEVSLMHFNYMLMYENHDGEKDASAPARQSFDEKMVKLEGCTLTSWQERGALPAHEEMFHDSFLKKCGPTSYQVDSIKFGGEKIVQPFLITATYPVERSMEFQPVIADILNSVKIVPKKKWSPDDNSNSSGAKDAP